MQPKLELYGLYRALQALKVYLIGVRNLIIEVDAKCIKGMLQKPDITPSTSINRWVIAILMYQFKLVHVPGVMHGPDGLSRRPRQPGDPPQEPIEDAEFDDWVDRMHSFIHHILPLSKHMSPMPATKDGQFFRTGEDSGIQAIFTLPAQVDNGSELTAEQSPVPYANIS